MEQTIRVRNIGKRYSVAPVRSSGNSLNEAIPGLASAILRPFTRKRGENVETSHNSEMWALRNVSFDLYPGNVLGILGRNGAGKSTLLKILSRVINPTEGDIDFRGRLGSLLETGAGFHPELSGRDNVFLSGSILGMTRGEIRRNFDAIVDFAEIEQFLDMPVKHYSNGMFVRLAFSVAAHLDPDILIIDEVLAVGDVRFQNKCREKIKEITGREKTIIMVSHDISAIVALCNKGILLEAGQIVASGDVLDCVDRYMGTEGEGDRASWRGDLGDDNIRLTSAAIRSGASSTVYQRGEVIDFQFTYEVLQPSPLIVVGVDFRSQVGALICATRFTDVAPPDQIAALQTAGRHTVLLKIDTSILAEGHYLVGVNLGIHNVKRVIEHEPVLWFSVVDPTRNRMHDAATYKSIVYPEWKWQEITD
jgi:lipopolysaccharide transport system ATP-binding protein